MSTEKPAAEWVRIGDLLPWERNPKAHPTENVAEIARSIVDFGFTEPIICWKSRKQVVAGHGRLLAAQMLYREDYRRKLATDHPGEAPARPEDGLVPVRWVEFADEHQAARYAIADNRLTEKNPMDAALVAEIFVELDAADVSLEGLGYADQELTAMLDPVGVDDVKWKEFDESVGNDAPKGKEIKCPHCGETFNK
jgi:ParB-like chromosome segregation protein Spo0J